jgi:mannose-6-phosphate isomerase-like protein (cupin superfamily)
MEVINRNKVKPFMAKDTTEIREILRPTNSSLKNQSLAEARVAPGKATLEHYHPKAEEIYYILKGKGKMKIDNEVRVIRSGDGIVILPGKRHKMWNAGEDDLVFLCCCSPAYSDEDTVMVE